MNHKHTIWNYVNIAIFALIFMLMGCPSPSNDNKASGASTNPNIWTQETESAGWAGRISHTTVVFDDKLWVMGGHDGITGIHKVMFKDDVWSSSDGKTWAKETDAGWTGRLDHTAVFFNDKIWVLGGLHNKIERKNDVWSSVDGKTWTQVAKNIENIKDIKNARWSARISHTTVVFDDKLWVMGGHDGITGIHKVMFKDDVWSSSDGKTWAKETDAGWTGRLDHTAVFFNDKIWVLGGWDGIYKNDVWS